MSGWCLLTSKHHHSRKVQKDISNGVGFFLTLARCRRVDITTSKQQFLGKLLYGIKKIGDHEKRAP